MASSTETSRASRKARGSLAATSAARSRGPAAEPLQPRSHRAHGSDRGRTTAHCGRLRRESLGWPCMDFALDATQQAIVANVEQLCAGFDLDYWRARDTDGEFPHELHAAIARAGYLGIAMPAEHGGGGPGLPAAGLGVRGVG